MPANNACRVASSVFMSNEEISKLKCQKRPLETTLLNAVHCVSKHENCTKNKFLQIDLKHFEMKVMDLEFKTFFLNF